MCRRFLLAILLLTSLIHAKAQFTITGNVITTRNEPLEGASISVKGSYDGATSGKDGSFSFSVADTGRKVLLVTMTGFKPFEKEISIKEPLTTIAVQLKEAITDLKAVVITAGTFEASDKKRATILKSIDIVTTAGQQADVVAALKTLPGAQQVGETEGLFVRGGTGTETKTFIDGMMVTNPFFSSVPGIAQRSRFSPLLFKGTVFSTGGYSAQYGQGLSSVLALETIDLPSRSEVNAIISSAQLSFLRQRLHKDGKGSDGININYNNLAPYFSVVRQKYSYNKAPEGINAELNLRRKLKNGILKFYGYTSFNEVGFNRPHLDVAAFDEQFHIKNNNVFTSATYNGRLGDNWQWYAGSSVSYNHDNIQMRTGNEDTTAFTFLPQLTNRTIQSKTVFTRNLSGLTKIYFGVEHQNSMDRIEAKDSIRKRSIDDHYLAGFVESDIYYSSKLVSKVGLRYEYSSLLKRAVVAPRVSFAYKLDDKSQVSFAYGTFYQKPETAFLLRNTSLNFTRATHYILNFQRVYNGQTLRVEAFRKDYKNLLTTNSQNAFAIANNGSGYAKGIELFWRDKTTIKNLDYWIAYSWLDTKRQYLDYPSLVQPNFAAKHTVNVVAKRWVNVLSTQFSGTYTYASGRPYFNPNKPAKDFMTDRTMDYHSLGLQANYLRTFGNINAVFIVNVSNALGSEQVFGYRYAGKANAQGQYNSEAVTPMAKRFVFVGMYLSIGSDRRKNILD
jgi:outer membrane cobalamin receptor